MMRLLRARANRLRTPSATVCSVAVKPGRSALVESASRASTPRSAVLGNGGQVGHGIPGQRCIVDLEVAGVDDDARRALNGKGQCIGNGMVDVDGLHGEAAQADLLAGTNLHKGGAGGKTVLFQLVA